MEITNLVCCSDSRCPIEIQVNQYCPGCIYLTQYTKCSARYSFIPEFSVQRFMDYIGNYIHYNDYTHSNLITQTEQG